MKAPRPIHLRRIFLCAGVGLAATLVACIGNYIESIHFYSASVPGKEVIDFGRVPSEVMVSSWNLEPGRGGSPPDSGIPEFPNYSGNPAAELFPKDDIVYLKGKSEYKFRQTIQKARNIEARGNIREALTIYRQADESLRVQSFIMDREEILNLGLNYRSRGVADYLKQRYRLEFGGEAMRIRALKALKNLKVDPRLRPHLEYTLASKVDRLQRKARADAFLTVAKKYPRSQRAEPAMVMAARSYLETASRNTPEDAEWKAGLKILKRVRARNSETRFIGSYYGWHGAYELQKGNVNQAISYYRKQSKLKNPREAYKGYQALAEIALKGGKAAAAAEYWLRLRQMPVPLHFKYLASQQLRDNLGDFSVKDVQRIQERIKGDANLLSSYLDFRLDDTPLPPEQEIALLKYATLNIRKTGTRDPRILSRLAQLQYNAGMYKEATRTAKRAPKGRSEAHMRLHYVEASSLTRIGRFREALSRYETVYQQNSFPYLRHAAGENLAHLNERHGDPRRSFMVYRDLDYKDDLGYLVDCVMTTQQLKSVISQISSQKDRNVFTYALAMRYFRQGKYSDAKETLLRLPMAIRMQGGLSHAEYKDFVDSISFDKTPVKHDVLEDVTAMAHLRRRADHAPTSAARAEALYGLAQYVHKRRTLLFYSPGLWKGGRASTYGIFWNHKLNKGRDNQLVIKRNVEHECDGQAMKFCEELIQKYPKSKLVPKALYTAAISAESMGRLNQFWSERNLPYVTKAMKYLDRLVKQYPSDPLVKNAKKYSEVFSYELEPDYYSDN